MNFTTAVLMMVFCSVVFTARTVNAGDVGLTLVVATPKTEVEVGKSVCIEFSLANKSNAAISMPIMDPLRQFTFVIVGPDKKAVGSTAAGREIQDRIAEGERISGKGAEMPSGSGRKYIVTELNRLFDMSLAGEYRITLKTVVPANAKGAETIVTSNEVRVTLVEPPEYKIARKVE